MAAHHGLHAIAAALTAVLLTRWATRAIKDAHGASTARAPWRRTAPQPARANTGGDRVAELHASFLDPALRETDAYLAQYWNRLEPLYPHRDSTP
ncbi:hypothetical protein ACFQ8S_02865 [Streptomyces virginiae]|uniref:hypothetical protein n=1 Tax=Streptomyces virginiae TaxID=1961 RepID=UPI0036984C3D